MSSNYSVALFGEAEKGQFYKAYYCRNLSQLVTFLGNPPPESRGLFYAVQALLYERDLIFFRVEEEGFSYTDYFAGFHILEDNPDMLVDMSAICLPGVGNEGIIKAVTPLCRLYNSILIMTEPDLYDYLTEVADGTYG